MKLPRFLKSPVLYITLFLFLLVGGVYWAFEYKERKALAKPDDVEIIQTWELGEELMELSGISYMGNGKMAAVQDEMGTVFVYDLEEGKVSRKIKFSGTGDFEAIAVVGNTAYVLESNGTIHEMEIPPDSNVAETSGEAQKQAKAKAKTYKIPEFKGSDMESLAYDKKENRLLLVAKENEAKTPQKKVYAFNLETKQLNPNPVFVLDLEGKIKEFDYGNELFGKDREFETILPSDMAVHPVSGNIFIVDSSNQLVLELSANGKLIAVYRLNSYIFKNPEGLSFSPNGEMYLASEGTVGSFANIWRVKLQQTKQFPSE